MKIIHLIKRLTRARPIISPVRTYFERVIIPVLGLYKVHSALFIGVGPYTYHYPKLFRNEGIELWTVDMRKDAEVWGANKHHFTDDICSDNSKLMDYKFDLVILMGVIGYGLNDQPNVEKALDSISKLVEHGGHILVACEKKFGIDPLNIVKENKIDIKIDGSYCFKPTVNLPNIDYDFHFFKKI